MSSTQGGSSQGSDASAVEGEEQDDPSSSFESLLKSSQDEWKKDFEVSSQLVIKTTGITDKEEIPHTVEDKARYYFHLGVENEEQGKLNDAIQNYRKAFQLVPDIDFRLSQNHGRTDLKNKTDLESKEKKALEKVMNERESVNDTVDADFNPDDGVDLVTHIQKKILMSGTRAVCSPQERQSATHISSLPTEVILYILRWVVSSDLDMRSLEMCSRVSRGFYICSRDPELWRDACFRVWGDGIFQGDSRLTKRNVDKRSDRPNWRDVFIRQPKPLYNGCYISKISYVRAGESSFQDTFYRPWHFVKYYRYLRFFADGIVLMLTTVDEPAQSVSKLRNKTSNIRGGTTSICAGTYVLCGSILYITVLSSEENMKSSNTNSEKRRHEMKLEVADHRKKYNQKLIWRGYSVLSDGSSTNFDLDANRYPPFVYSRVKSYTAESLQALPFSHL